LGLNLKVCIKIQNAENVVQYEVGQYATKIFGRNKSSDFQIEDPEMSGQHFSLTFNGKKLILRDLKSKNGTYLNGIRIEKSEVFIGDVIKAGKSLISINPEKMVADTVKFLTFSGSPSARMSYELRMDFTAMREFNPAFFVGRGQLPKEALTKGKKTQFPGLSKLDVKNKHSLLSLGAICIDLLILLLLLTLPVLFFDRINLSAIPTITEHREVVIILVELLLLFNYSILNFKWSRFTLGEKVIGLEDKFLNQ
jgi:pSer/pThr/pTyr-binding forkhead associated (FHA) protein